MDFLHHNHKPRVDYLVWVLLQHLGPRYILQLDNQATHASRTRGLSAWREAFRSEWRRCQVTQITLPLNPRYNPLPYKWVCTCPAFVKSRFLLCKHLVQAVNPVPEEFFAEINRERRCPIWRHPKLRPINPPGTGDLQTMAQPTMPLASAEGVVFDQVEGGEVGGPMDGEQEEHSEEDEEEQHLRDIVENMEEEHAVRCNTINEIASRLHELADMLQYNAPFADHHVVELVTRKTATALDLQDKIKNKENKMNATTGTKISTFSSTFAEVMFVRTRPLARTCDSHSKYTGDS